MHRLRTRLIVAFLAATALPLAATIWVTTALLDRSLAYSSTADLDRLSRTFEDTVRQFYQHERDALRSDVIAGRMPAETFAAADRPVWPATVRDFWESGEEERFALDGQDGDRLNLLRRQREGRGVELFTRGMPGIKMEALAGEIRRSRSQVSAAAGQDLRRGFTFTLFLLLGVVWLVSLVPLMFIAHRIAMPIRQLTAALAAFAGGDWSRRIPPAGDDEVGRAAAAFNHMADELRQQRDRLVHLTQMASWQSLARKTAHELKNSLTPIRLTVEEMVARQPAGADRAFMAQAAQIVIGEIDTLERRVRAFSDFSSEPPVHLTPVDVHAVVLERIALARAAHPDVAVETRFDATSPAATADADLLKGLLTNLLQNAAEASPGGGSLLVTSRCTEDHVVVEVHDSGPGLREEARRTLFEPTITFKKQGMGLGLSIAKKNALLCGGDIALVTGLLGGAGFRITLRHATGS